MTWIALFSNTGNEIAEISKKLGRLPDRILCDKKRIDWNEHIIDKVELMSHDTILSTLASRVPLASLVTLHGYLRVLPAYAILPNTYNVHPGDIINYPELKGIHPQRKALELGLKTTGVVIHKVTPKVDDGLIYDSMQYTIVENETEESLINNLRNISINMWVKFIKERL